MLVSVPLPNYVEAHFCQEVKKTDEMLNDKNKGKYSLQVETLSQNFDLPPEV